MQINLIFDNQYNIKNLDLKFEDLETTAKLGSTEAFQKFETQLNSRFMKD